MVVCREMLNDVGGAAMVDTRFGRRQLEDEEREQMQGHCSEGHGNGRWGYPRARHSDRRDYVKCAGRG